VQPADQPGPHPQDHPHPDRSGQPAQQGAFDDRMAIECPAGGVAPGALHHGVVRSALLAEKTDDRVDAGTTHLAFPDATRRQPAFIELEPCGYQLIDRLVQAGGQHSPDFRLRHEGDLLSLAASVWTAAIIAGGLAQRLDGLDKSQLVIDGRRIVDRQLSVLGHVAEHILIVSNDHHRFRSSGLRVCADLIPGAGPLSGLYTALVMSPSARTLVVACDLPFLTASFLRHLAARMGRADAAIPRTEEGLQPLCAVYDRTCAEPIRDRLERGQLRVAGLVDALRVTDIGPAEVALFDPDGTLFFNVNTPNDYKRAIDLAARRRL